jgi:hypothetical protein
MFLHDALLVLFTSDAESGRWKVGDGSGGWEREIGRKQGVAPIRKSTNNEWKLAEGFFK